MLEVYDTLSAHPGNGTAHLADRKIPFAVFKLIIHAVLEPD